MEPAKFNAYLDAMRAIKAENYLEEIYSNNYADLSKNARKQIQKRWHSQAYGWKPKKTLSLTEAMQVLEGG